MKQRLKGKCQNSMLEIKAERLTSGGSAGRSVTLVEMEESSRNLLDGFLFSALKICPVGAKPRRRGSHHLCWRRPQEEEEKVGSCHLDFPSLAGLGLEDCEGRGVNY